MSTTDNISFYEEIRKLLFFLVPILSEAIFPFEIPENSILESNVNGLKHLRKICSRHGQFEPENVNNPL